MPKAIARSAHPSIAQLTRQAKQLAAELAERSYELGRIFSHVLTDERYREAGYSSFADYVHDEVGLSRSTASRAIAMYRHFSAKIARAYGVSKLVAGLAYMRATPKDERPGDLIAATLRIRGKSGRFVRVKFHNASVRQVKQATEIVLDENRSRRIPARLRKRVAVLGEKLPAAPKSLTHGDRIRLSRDMKTGEYYATFTAIPMNALDEYIAFLKNFRANAGV